MRAHAQLLRAASAEPLWPDWDEEGEEQQQQQTQQQQGQQEQPHDAAPPTSEWFGYLPWFISVAWYHRGIPGYWVLHPPAQVGLPHARETLPACLPHARETLPACLPNATETLPACLPAHPHHTPRVHPPPPPQVLPHLVNVGGAQEFMWRGVRPRVWWWAVLGCAHVPSPCTHGCTPAHPRPPACSTGGGTGRWTTRLITPTTRRRCARRPQRPPACWHGRQGRGGTPAPRQSSGGWLCRWVLQQGGARAAAAAHKGWREGGAAMHHPCRSPAPSWPHPRAPLATRTTRPCAPHPAPLTPAMQLLKLAALTGRTLLMPNPPCTSPWVPKGRNWAAEGTEVRGVWGGGQGPPPPASHPHTARPHRSCACRVCSSRARCTC